MWAVWAQGFEPFPSVLNASGTREYHDEPREHCYSRTPHCISSLDMTACKVDYGGCKDERTPDH